MDGGDDFDFDFEVLGESPTAAPIAAMRGAGERNEGDEGGRDPTDGSTNGAGAGAGQTSLSSSASSGSGQIAKIRVVDRARGRVDVFEAGGGSDSSERAKDPPSPAPSSSIAGKEKKDLPAPDRIQQRLIDVDAEARLLSSREQNASADKPIAGRWRRLFQAGRAVVAEQVYSLGFTGSNMSSDSHRTRGSAVLASLTTPRQRLPTGEEEERRRRAPGANGESPSAPPAAADDTGGAETPPSSPSTLTVRSTAADEPIYLLGRFYVESAFNTSLEDSETPSGILGQAPLACAPQLLQAQFVLPPYVADFAADFHSLFWCTYRRDFAPLVPVAPHLTSDTTWGCLLRSMQMLLGHTLLRHLLGRDWRLNDRDVLASHSVYRQVRRWFCDEDDPRCPYSLHNMIRANSQIEETLLQMQRARTTRARRKLLQENTRRLNQESNKLQAGDDGNGVGVGGGGGGVSFGGGVDLSESGLSSSGGGGGNAGGGQRTADPDRANVPGEYFSPTRVCQIVKRLVRSHSPGGLTAYVATHAHLVRSRVIALATQTMPGDSRSPPRSPSGSFRDASGASRPPSDGPNPVPGPDSDSCDSNDSNESSNSSDSGDSEPDWRPVLILVPVRLGADCVSEVYLDQLRTIFRMPECCGVVGGRPRSSLYFVGYQQEQLFFLDPHVVRAASTLDAEVHTGDQGRGQREAIDPKSMADFVEDLHTPYPMAMRLADIDPSLAFGFLCGSRRSFDHLCDQMERLRGLGYPLFHVVDTPGDTGMVSSSSSDAEPLVVPGSGLGDIGGVGDIGRSDSLRVSPVRDVPNRGRAAEDREGLSASVVML
jgi:Peptidase family C54